MSQLYTVEDVKKFIEDGEKMFISGDEKLLSELPEGYWIGGTIPYFMSDEGGVIDKDHLFVNFLPDSVSAITIKTYSADKIDKVYADAYSGGFSVMVIPATSPVHLDFALKASEFDDFLKVPLIGWISGVHLDDLGSVSPKVFFGPKQKAYSDRAVVIHCQLKENKHADINIINVFEPDMDSPAITFPEDSFSAETCMIDGEERKFADYIEENGIDTKRPLVADYNGVMINISFQNVDQENGKVDFYAPVFKDVVYHAASSMDNYIEEFNRQLSEIEGEDKVILSFNCILNFLYCELEGKKTGNITGPITFGEIAYQLLNQTLVYLTIS